MEAEHPYPYPYPYPTTQQPPPPPPLYPRRRKRLEEEEPALFAAMDLDGAAAAAARLAADKLKTVVEDLGREIRVFSSTTFESIPSTLPRADHEEDDEFYELQPADYFKLVSNSLAGQSQVLKTRKMREAELAAQQAKRTKTTIRVRFPDSYILEADFHPSETLHSLVDLLTKLIARPDLPFYLYTVPPKKRILDTSQNFFAVGFVPGANVLFSYDLPEGSELNTDDVKSGPYLREEIRALDGLSLVSKPAHQSDDSKTDTASADQYDASQSDFAPPANKKTARPKWFKR